MAASNADADDTANNLCFFKVYTLRTTLTIPPAFRKRIKREDTNTHVSVEGPTGQQWRMYLAHTHSNMEYQQGWKKFVADHKLEFGDFLIFKYIPGSKFLVQIFAKTGCMKIIPNISSDLVSINHDRGEENDRKHDTFHNSSSVGSVQNQQVEVLTETKLYANANQDPKASLDNAVANKMGKKNSMKGSIMRKRKLETKKEGKKTTKLMKDKNACAKPQLISCRRPITKMEREKAISDAKSFTSRNPYTIITMMPSHVYNGFWLGFPKRNETFKLPVGKIGVTLLDADNKQWKCIYIKEKKHSGLSGGWRKFSMDHNLEQDDLCLFELLDPELFIFRVHIFRVIEECTPYKKRDTNDQTSKEPIKSDANEKGLRKQKGRPAKEIKLDESSS